MSAFKKVLLEGIVALKITRHCEHSDEDAKGVLLGLLNESEGQLEVTQCYPLPPDLPKEDRQAFLGTMMKGFEPNIDTHVVGWYCSTTLGIKKMVSKQFKYQNLTMGAGVMLSFNPSDPSGLPLHASVLTDYFMKAHAADQWTRDSLLQNKLSSTQIFQKVPVEVRNSGLVNAFLLQLLSGPVSHSPLSISPLSHLEKQMQTLSENLDSLTHENSRLLNFSYQTQKILTDQSNWLLKQQVLNQQRKSMNQQPVSEDLSDCPYRLPSEPKRLEALQSIYNINNLAQNLNSLAELSLTKEYLAFQKL